MKNSKLVVLIVLGFIFVVIPCMGDCANPVKPIELKYATAFPPTHSWVVADQRFFDKIEKETNGMVKVRIYAGGSLVSPREDYAELVKGAADIADCSLDYTPSGFDVYKIWANFFYGITDIETERRISVEVFQKFPEMQAELVRSKLLVFGAVPPYQVLTSKKPVNAINDFKGLRLKATAGFFDILKGVGAEAITMPMSETYVSMEKGIVHGALAPCDTLKSFRFAEVVHYITKVNYGVAGQPRRFMNLNCWNSLPPEIQEVFEKNFDFWASEMDKEMTKANQIGIDEAKKMGAQFIELSPEELNKFYDIAKAVALKKAAELDAKGIPGTKIFYEVRRLVDQYSK
jgi:TRAP-type C4-dicarboxylate transport system substrate-binding protein